MPPNHRDKEVLIDLYYNEKLSTDEIGNRLGVAGRTVRDAMNDLNIPTRSSSEAKKLSSMKDGPPLSKDVNGYMRWSHWYDNDRDRVYVHRLLAVLKYGIDELDDKVVHHKNEHKIDNRPENIELLTREEHINTHNYD